MVRLVISFLIFSLLLTFKAAGQVKSTGPVPILFHGVVMDASTQARLGGSEIILNRVARPVSSEDGVFSFYAFKMDTVVFRMLGYKPLIYIISDTLSGRDFLTGIYLESDTVQIGEVIIIPKVSDLRGELMNPRITIDPKTANAVANVSAAAYTGRTTPGKLGDPASNYEYLHQKAKIDAFEKGGIPSDKMIGLNPLLLIPAAYMLLHGRPETPPPPKPQISQKEIDEIKQRYNEIIKNRK
jgi:hypothetical protein